MKVNYFKGLSPEGFHTLCYAEWGEDSAKTAVICVHGLTRNKSDFQFLAEDLGAHFRVAALDVAGRGQSDHLMNAEHYSYAQYIKDAANLINRLKAEEIYWIGTSMGGLIGMILASLPNTPIKKLILNDIGPYIPKEAINRIKNYASKKLVFNTHEEGAKTLRQLYAPFGKLTEDQWRHVIDYTLVKEKEGVYTIAYDPNATYAIVEDNPHSDVPTEEDEKGNVVFWKYWDKISCPTLVINGENSDILTPEIIKLMRSRGPKFDYYVVKEAGHAPSLMEPTQRQTVVKWLTTGSL